MGDPRADQIHDGPFDGTRLGIDLAAEFPELHREIRHAEWRMALRRRVRERLEAARQRETA